MPLVRRPQKAGTLISNPGTAEWDQRLDPGSSTFADDIKDKLLSNYNPIWTPQWAQSLAAATCLLIKRPSSGPNEPWIYDSNTSTYTFDASKGSPLDNDFWLGVRRELSYTVLNIKNGSIDFIQESGLSASLKAQLLGEFAKLTFPDTKNPAVVDVKSKFPANQYRSGIATGYYLGNKIVSTAGHCVSDASDPDDMLERPQDYMVVFNWKGNVDKSPNLVCCDVSRIILYDAPRSRSINRPTDDKTRNELNWSRRWDGALIELKSEPTPKITPLILSDVPPAFCEEIFNCGTPHCKPLKMSMQAHVLRHDVDPSNKSALSRQISAPYGTYSTTLDQFPGNSGGPVCSTTSGKIVGHTNSTVSEGVYTNPMTNDRVAVADWGTKYLAMSPNYTCCQTMNSELRKAGWPDASLMYPMNLRVFENNITCVMVSETGPNGAVLPPTDKSYMSFTRHDWNDPTVFHHNLSSRVDRYALFLRAFRSLADIKTPSNAPPNLKISKVTLAMKVRYSAVPVLTDPGFQIQILTAYGQTYWKADPKKIRINPVGPNEFYLEADIDTSSLTDGLSNLKTIEVRQTPNNPEAQSVGINFRIDRDAMSLPAAVPQNIGDFPLEWKQKDDDKLVWPAEVFEYVNGGSFVDDVGRTNVKTKVLSAALPLWQNPRQPMAESLTVVKRIPDYMANTDPKLAWS